MGRWSSDVQNSIFLDIDFTTWLTGSPEKLNSVRLSSAPLRLNRRVLGHALDFLAVAGKNR